MPPIPQRPVSEHEAAVLVPALSRASLGDVGPQMIDSISRLLVIGRCDCGCDSVTFERRTTAQNGYRVADGVGYLESGEEIGVLVWAVGDELAELELYNYGEEPAGLPQPESVCAHAHARKE